MVPYKKGLRAYFPDAGYIQPGQDISYRRLDETPSLLSLDDEWEAAWEKATPIEDLPRIRPFDPLSLKEYMVVGPLIGPMTLADVGEALKAWNKPVSLEGLPKCDLTLEPPKDIRCGPTKMKWREIKKGLKDEGFVQVELDYDEIPVKTAFAGETSFAFGCKRFELGGLVCFVPEHPKNKNRFWI